jgi:hypothetical protein
MTPHETSRRHPALEPARSAMARPAHPTTHRAGGPVNPLAHVAVLLALVAAGAVGAVRVLAETTTAAGLNGALLVLAVTAGVVLAVDRQLAGRPAGDVRRRTRTAQAVTR